MALESQEKSTMLFTKWRAPLFFRCPQQKFHPAEAVRGDKDAAKQLLESLYGCFLLPYPEPMSRHVPNGRQQCAAGGFVWQRSGSFSIEWSQIEGLVFGACLVYLIVVSKSENSGVLRQECVQRGPEKPGAAQHGQGLTVLIQRRSVQSKEALCLFVGIAQRMI